MKKIHWVRVQVNHHISTWETIFAVENQTTRPSGNDLRHDLSNSTSAVNEPIDIGRATVSSISPSQTAAVSSSSINHHEPDVVFSEPMYEWELMQERTVMAGGIYGYLTPEFIYRNELVTKSDVCSLRVLLIEIVSGLKSAQAVDSVGCESIFSWGTPLVQANRYTELLDPLITTDIPEAAASVIFCYSSQILQWYHVLNYFINFVLEKTKFNFARICSFSRVHGNGINSAEICTFRDSVHFYRYM